MSQIPSYCLDCVVAIGYVAPDSDATEWVASGFLYGERASDLGPKQCYRVYLVTNRHVVAGRDRIALRFNPTGTRPAEEYLLHLQTEDGTCLWSAPAHPDADVAVVSIDYSRLRRHAMQVSFFASDINCATHTQLRRQGVAEGDFVYILGFPMGMVGGRRNGVIVRGGTIARIQEALKASAHEFLVDALVFPGNSGGPVILKPDSSSGESRPTLIGVVSSYVAYQEAAVSAQTERVRLTFEENSGLASVQVMDLVHLAIRQLPGEGQDGARTPRTARRPGRRPRQGKAGAHASPRG